MVIQKMSSGVIMKINEKELADHILKKINNEQIHIDNRKLEEAIAEYFNEVSLY